MGCSSSALSGVAACCLLVLLTAALLTNDVIAIEGQTPTLTKSQSLLYYQLTGMQAGLKSPLATKSLLKDTDGLRRLP